MKKILWIIVLSLVLNASSHAEYQSVGAVSCDGIITADKNNNKTVRYQISDWMKGYITGRNYPNGLKGESIRGEGLFYEVLNYCKKNPLHATPQAAEIIYNKLK